jgi:asparagine synthase (glutamine-hydrolysing)
MAMAHSVEGRYPFLDHRLIEFCSKLQPGLLLRGLNEKYLLKQLVKDRIPDQVVNRPKQAYRAPVSTSLLSGEAPEYIREMLSFGQISKHGIFKPKSVERLIGKMDSGNPVTEIDNMAIAGILSTQILLDLFVYGNNPFRTTQMLTECPIHYDRKLNKSVL